jgi:hypothetical protein
LELPKPEEVVAALMSFPPKLSVLVKPLTVPEDLFESTAKSAGVELPPGPHKMLVSLMSSFEEMTPTALPLPGLRAPAATTATTQTEVTAKGFEIK